jgi:hypothetical protein
MAVARSLLKQCDKSFGRRPRLPSCPHRASCTRIQVGGCWQGHLRADTASGYWMLHDYAIQARVDQEQRRSSKGQHERLVPGRLCSYDAMGRTTYATLQRNKLQGPRGGVFLSGGVSAKEAAVRRKRTSSEGRAGDGVVLFFDGCLLVLHATSRSHLTRGPAAWNCGYS